MTQSARDNAPDLAPEAPGLGQRVLQSRRERAGFATFIPAECLKIGSKLWSEVQREQGVWLKGVYLTASEEEDAIGEAQREGKGGAVGIYQIRKSLVAVADSIAVFDEETQQEKLAPGAWKLIPSLEIRPYWEELGPQGRGLFAQAFQTANTPSDAAREVAKASFRTVG